MNENVFVIEDGLLKEYLGSDSEVTIPEGVTSIGEGAFACCCTLTRVVIPDSVQRIDVSAF